MNLQSVWRNKEIEGLFEKKNKKKKTTEKFTGRTLAARKFENLQGLLKVILI